MLTGPKKLDLNDLPKWSEWPARLLGLQTFAQVQRDRDKIDREYSRDKWQKCDDLYESSNRTLSADDLRKSYHEFTSGDQRPHTLNNELLLARISDIQPLYDDLLVDLVKLPLQQSEHLVELGSGPGFIISMLASKFPGKHFSGGDYAESAVSLAAKLFASSNNVKGVEKFDYYAHSYPLLERLEGPITVLTCQSLEQIPSAAQVIETLKKYKNKLHRIVHLEPCYALYDNSLLGLMRKRYIEINDYNKDLVSCLKGRSDVIIHRLDANVIGWNAFNSLARIEWSFRP